MTGVQPRTIHFPRDEEPFVVGARLHSLLAFPGPDESPQRERAEVALCSEAIAITDAVDPEIAETYRMAFPAYAHADPREFRWAHTRIRRRLGPRMQAARMSLGFFYEAFAKQPVVLPNGMTRLSLNQLAELVHYPSASAESHNFEQRVWRASVPVIHIAAAIQWVLRVIAPGPDPHAYDLNRGDLHDIVLELAALHEAIVLSDVRFGKQRAERLIRLDRTPLSSSF